MNLKNIFILNIVILCAQINYSQNNQASYVEDPIVTFIELGSIGCISCKKMEPIMRSVEKKFGSKLKVVFYNVLTQHGKKYADSYKIKVIPTQVFLDENGKEYFRHEGYFPEEDLIKIIKQKGI